MQRSSHRCAGVSPGDGAGLGGSSAARWALCQGPAQATDATEITVTITPSLGRIQALLSAMQSPTSGILSHATFAVDTPNAHRARVTRMYRATTAPTGGMQYAR